MNENNNNQYNQNFNQQYQYQQYQPPKPPKTPKEPFVDIALEKTKKRLGKLIPLFLVLIVAGVLYSNSFVVTKPNQYTMIQQFGKVVAVRDEPGLSFKIPFVQNAKTIPNTVLLYDLPISDVITKDKKTMVADSFVLWKVSDPLTFIQTLNGNVSNAEARISTIVYNSMKNVISNLSQTEIISGRDTLAQSIFANIGGGLDKYGIELVAVETKRLDLPDDNKQAVYERMISERNNIAASYQAEGESEATKIRSETDKTISIQIAQAEAQAAKIEAEGEAEYMRILSEAYADESRADFYSFVRSLDAAKLSMSGDNKTLILTPDSPLAQIFYNAQ
ncbi:MAG: protease modulator HflC [Oscillospiraceae bacterium]|nr:protease modulator HflC [Oscillospiraceae bacterium]